METREVITEYAAGRRDFSGEDLRPCDFFGAKLSGATFSRAKLRGTDFRRADLRFTNFDHTHFSHSDFEGASMRHASAKHADIYHARFVGADLSNADLSNSNFTDTIFRGANLQGTSLQGARGLVQTQLQDAFLDEATVLPEPLRSTGRRRALGHGGWHGPWTTYEATLRFRGDADPKTFRQLSYELGAWYDNLEGLAYLSGSSSTAEISDVRRGSVELTLVVAAPVIAALAALWKNVVLETLQVGAALAKQKLEREKLRLEVEKLVHEQRGLLPQDATADELLTKLLRGLQRFHDAGGQVLFKVPERGLESTALLREALQELAEAQKHQNPDSK